MYTCIGTSDISLNLWRELSPKHKCSHICSRSCFPLCHPFHKFMQSPSSYSVLVFLLVDAIEGFLRLPLDESRRTPWLYVAPLAEVLFPRFLSFVPSLFLVSIPMPGSFLFPRFPTCVFSPPSSSRLFLHISFNFLAQPSRLEYDQCVYFCQSHVIIYNSSGYASSLVYRVAYIQYDTHSLHYAP